MVLHLHSYIEPRSESEIKIKIKIKIKLITPLEITPANQYCVKLCVQNPSLAHKAGVKDEVKGQIGTDHLDLIDLLRD